ncbi:HAD-IA family hydrolase [Patescibacteria group bacterium]|nr:HAD-IA family hydrolase [Patescibacteria group bacterium]
MNRFIFFFAIVLLVTSGASAFAADVPADAGTGGAPVPADAGSQSAPAEIKPEPQAESMPVAELATSSAAGSSNPRPVPTAEPAKPLPVVPVLPVTETESAPAPVSVSTTSQETGMAPWVWLLGLLSIAGGGIYGAYSYMKASQPKEAQSGNTCDAIQESIDQKKYELSLAENEVSFYEEALRVLEEKAQEKAEAEKNKVVKKVEGVAKDVLLGKKNDSDARTVFDTAEKAIDTYEDIQKKIQKTKEVVEMLRGKRDGLRAESKALEASYVACVANLPDAAKVFATGGIKLAVPGTRPVRAIIFDFYGVFFTEVAVPWFRSVFPDVAQADAMKARYCEPSDKGEINEDDFFAALGALQGKTGPEVRSTWIASGTFNEELAELTKILRRNFKLALCSNSQPKLFEDISTANGVPALFDEIVVSSQVRLVKPDPKIFKLVLSRLTVDASEALFFDDNVVNVAAARKLGIRSFVFTDTGQFRKDLESVGVSVKLPKDAESTI